MSICKFRNVVLHSRSVELAYDDARVAVPGWGLSIPTGSNKNWWQWLIWYAYALHTVAGTMWLHKRCRQRVMVEAEMELYLGDLGF